LGKAANEITAEDVVNLTEEWKSAVVRLDRMLYADARKEFSASAQTGFGIDGNEDVKHADFEAVRGKFEENSFVAEIERHITSKTKLADELINRLKKFLC
jgi:hypothetical protein